VVAGAQPLDYQRVVGYFIQRAADNGATVAVIADSENSMSKRATMTVSYAEADKVARAAADAKKIVLVYSLGIKGKVIAAFRQFGDRLFALALSPGRNEQGAAAVGLTHAVPNSAKTQLFLLGEQSEAQTLMAQLNGAFTVVQASYQSPLVEKADVVLPTPVWYERTGHVTDYSGAVRPVAEVLPKPAAVRDDAEVLAALAAML
jgi:NADH dehydrogenase/NADH:ubiquinone oxidoreductase subunit G